MEVSAKEFFEMLAIEPGVTFQGLASRYTANPDAIGFDAYDGHGNVIGRAILENGVYVFTVK
jgi:hypothetical protein